jgi:hypothetical protein
MPMTTDGPGNLVRWAIGVAAAMSVWLVGVIVCTVAIEPTRTVMIIGPDRKSLVSVVERFGDIALVDGSDRSMIVSGSPGFVRRLYTAGAWLVLPVRASGCAPARDVPVADL